MARLTINGGNSGTPRITDMEAAEVFEFSGSKKGNNGLCVRVKDTKAGKGRFINLESGKLLRAGYSDRGTPVDADVSY
jgi:hypothetical protein